MTLASLTAAATLKGYVDVEDHKVDFSSLLPATIIPHRHDNYCHTVETLLLYGVDS